MKLLVVNFSISNSGDFLIEERMNSLVKKTFPCADIEFINGLEDALAEGKEHEYDMIFAGGGPYYDDRIVEDIFLPFFHKIICGRTRIHIIGAGVYGEDFSDKGIYQKKFGDTAMQFFKSIEKNGGTFGCRDEISWRVMKNNGLSNVYITGCPAWYDFSFIDQVDVKMDKKISKIVISDPGVTKCKEEQECRAMQAVSVINEIRTLFPEAEIRFTFNNGILTKYSRRCNEIIRNHLIHKDIAYYDMSGDAAMFNVYNDADIHVGFRVHSHIYSLSRRIPSILIEEDLRGYGMNETLGLPHLPSYDLIERHLNNRYQPNQCLNNHLADLIQYNLATGFARYEGVFRIMKQMYYNNFINWSRMVNSEIQ